MPIGGFIFGKFVFVQGRKKKNKSTPTPPPDHPYWDKRISPLSKEEEKFLGTTREQEKSAP